MNTKAVFLLIALACIHSSKIFADSLRCGTELVATGDTKAEVTNKCGQPETTDSYCRNEYFQGKLGIDVICHKVDLWTFNRGAGTFLMKVEFEEGQVKSIANGERVN